MSYPLGKTLGIHPIPPLIRPRVNSPYIIKKYHLSKYVDDENWPSLKTG